MRQSNKSVIADGRDCFKTFYSSFKSRLSNNRKVLPKNATIDQALTAYEIIYNENKSDLSHYFRTIYHIFKFIDTSQIEDKKTYASIARAQLSSYEQILMFYNCLHKHGIEKFKPLIEKYSIFKNIDQDLIFNESHLSEYDQSAYGKKDTDVTE